MKSDQFSWKIGNFQLFHPFENLKTELFFLGFLRSLRNSQFFWQKCLSFFYAQFFWELSFFENVEKKPAVEGYSFTDNLRQFFLMDFIGSMWILHTPKGVNLSRSHFFSGKKFWLPVASLERLLNFQCYFHYLQC